MSWIDDHESEINEALAQDLEGDCMHWSEKLVLEFKAKLKDCIRPREVQNLKTEYADYFYNHLDDEVALDQPNDTWDQDAYERWRDDNG